MVWLGRPGKWPAEAHRSPEGSGCDAGAAAVSALAPQQGSFCGKPLEWIEIVGAASWRANTVPGAWYVVSGSAVRVRHPSSGPGYRSSKAAGRGWRELSATFRPGAPSWPGG